MVERLPNRSQNMVAEAIPERIESMDNKLDTDYNDDDISDGQVLDEVIDIVGTGEDMNDLIETLKEWKAKVSA